MVFETSEIVAKLHLLLGIAQQFSGVYNYYCSIDKKIRQIARL